MRPEAPPVGAALHWRALEGLYASAPVNRLFDSALTIEGEGRSSIAFTVEERHFHAAGAAHGTIYFKMLDDAAFYAANTLVTDRFLLTTSFNLHFTPPGSRRQGSRRRALDQRPAAGAGRRGTAGRCARRGNRPRHGHFHALAHRAERTGRLCRWLADGRAMIEEPRLPARLEVAALIRLAQNGGGFAAVLKSGEEAAGTVLLVLTENGVNTRVYERMPQVDGSRAWHCSKIQDIENKQKFYDYLDRRGRQDPDLWIVELDIANGERLIGLPPAAG